MVTIVVILNVLIALLGFYAAWQMWRLRNALSQAADALVVAEYHTHRVLQNAPEAILQGQVGTRQLRQNYQALNLTWQQAQRAIAVVGFGRMLLQRQRRFQASRSLTRSSKKSRFSRPI